MRPASSRRLGIPFTLPLLVCRYQPGYDPLDHMKDAKTGPACDNWCVPWPRMCSRASACVSVFPCRVYCTGRCGPPLDPRPLWDEELQSPAGSGNNTGADERKRGECEYVCVLYAAVVIVAPSLLPECDVRAMVLQWSTCRSGCRRWCWCWCWCRCTRLWWTGCFTLG